MRLLLIRKHRRKLTSAVLCCGKTTWAKMFAVREDMESVPPGEYECFWDYSEKHDWHLRLVQVGGPAIARILPLQFGKVLQKCAFFPVTSFENAAETPQLAFQRLTDRMEPYPGEDWKVEIMDLPPKTKKPPCKLAS
jgi:hypothetical protein